MEDMSEHNQERSIIPLEHSSQPHISQQQRTYPLLIIRPPRTLPPPILIPVHNQSDALSGNHERQVQLLTLLDPLVQLFVCIQASASRRIEASLHVPASMLRPGSLLFLPRHVLLQASLRIVQNFSPSAQTENAQPTSNSTQIATPAQIAQEELSAVLNVDGIYLLVASQDELSEQQFQEILNRLGQLHQPQGPPPAAESVIKALPIVEVTEQMVHEGHKCVICCDELESGRPNVVKLPCNHLFDKDCVENWLKQHNTCPVCRYALPTENQAPSTTPTTNTPNEMQPGSSQRMDIEPQPTSPDTQPTPPTEVSQESEPSTAPHPMEIETTNTISVPPSEEQPEPEIMATIPSQKEKKLSGLKRGFFNQKRPKVNGNN